MGVGACPFGKAGELGGLSSVSRGCRLPPSGGIDRPLTASRGSRCASRSFDGPLPCRSTRTAVSRRSRSDVGGWPCPAGLASVCATASGCTRPVDGSACQVRKRGPGPAGEALLADSAAVPKTLWRHHQHTVSQPRVWLPHVRQSAGGAARNSKSAIGPRIAPKTNQIGRRRPSPPADQAAASPKPSIQIRTTRVTMDGMVRSPAQRGYRAPPTAQSVTVRHPRPG